MRFVLSAFLFSVVASGAMAFDKVETRAQLMDLIGDKTIGIWLYGLKLNVRDSGKITGRAVGGKITGDWTWEDGYFCRTMYWGDREIPYNCQLVEIDGNKIRFTVDKGAGDDATFRITD